MVVDLKIKSFIFKSILFETVYSFKAVAATLFNDRVLSGIGNGMIIH